MGPLAAICTLVVAASPVEGVASSTTSRPALVAIVIGNNHPLPKSGYEPLQYADDDAIRFAQFFESIGAEVFLSTGADHDTATLYPAMADRAHIPTRRHVLELFDRAAVALEAKGDRPRELFFYFSGHGSVTTSEAYLHLVDGRLSRTDIHERILRRMSADRIHGIIDSCHSYFLLNARGERVAVAEDEESLGKYPHAGFLLSTSSKKEVHEWSGYRAGVFSYQVLGALRGAADVDGDRSVSYAEAQAYIVAANVGVRNAAARILPYVHRPAVRGDDLIDLGSLAERRWVEVPEDLGGHFVVSDDRGVRVLDANKPVATHLALVADVEQPLFLQLEDRTYEAELAAEGRRSFALRVQPTPDAVRVATRGTVADEFRERLFARPLTEEFVAGIDAATGAGVRPLVRTQVLAPNWLEDPMTVGLLGSGSAATVLGIVSTGLFLNWQARFDSRPVSAQHESYRSRAELWRGVMIGSYATGASLIAAGLLRAWLTNSSEPARIAVVPNESGVAIGGVF